MRLHIKLAPLVLLLIGLQACAQTNQTGTNKRPVIEVVVNPAIQYQTIEHFGASDAWACQFVGKWPDEKKNAIADLLFSTDTLPDGSPRGIGLSIWRFNIGGGSIEQGDASGIRDEWRRAESFMDNNGQLDFNKQAGQTWFLQAAKLRGVPYFLGFVNSPPVALTKTGRAFAQNGQANLTPESYPAYASFLAATITAIHAKTGVRFDYISPVNEPQNDWSDGGQEGSPYLNTEIYGIARTLNDHFTKENIPTKLIFSESFEIKYLLGEYDKPGRGNQLKHLFTAGSGEFLGNLKQAEKRIAYHSYLSSSPNSKAIQTRKELAQQVKGLDGYKVWQSEYCVLGDNEGELRGEKRDLGMKTALYVANLIHNDLVYANATAWHWWLAVSPYDYKDGLVYVDKNKTDGNYYDSKLLWAMGNYSRFVRPGMIRIAADLNKEDEQVTVSAYLNPVTNKQVLIVSNRSSMECRLQLISQNGNVQSLDGYASYSTSATQRLQKKKVSGTSLVIPAGTVVSLVQE
jgi:O-glycosyl hydrolase